MPPRRPRPAARPAPTGFADCLPGPEPARRVRLGLLAGVVVLAAVLRLAHLGISPPGLNQDEAVIAWNAWCLLKTGKDQAGEPWPIFYCHALGVPHDMLSIYALIPFQALGGMNVVTTRLPAAVAGILTVLLAYVVARRLFGTPVGLLAAALLALNPWHLQQSRWGHEAPLCPLLMILPLAILLGSGLPLAGGGRQRPRVALAALGGLLLGVSFYGYAAIRLFLPPFYLAAVLINLKGWWACLKTRRGGAAVAAAALGFALTFGPFAWKQITDPQAMSARGETTFVWKHTASTGQAVAQIARRYVGHFLPDWLFLRGDPYVIQSPPDTGMFHWYMLPLLGLGALAVALRFRRSVASRLLAVWVLTYPLPDILSWHLEPNAINLHALRSLPGMVALPVLGAVGAVAAGWWLWQRNRSVARAAATALALAVVALNVRYLWVFFGEFNRRPEIYHRFHVDLMEACRWLRPQMPRTDAVFLTTTGTNAPFIVALVGLDYDPRQWQAEPRQVVRPAEWDLYLRAGELHSMYGDAFVPALRELQNNGRPDRAVFIIRPAEYRQLAPLVPLGPPVHRIIGPQGAEVLWICTATL